MKFYLLTAGAFLFFCSTVFSMSINESCDFYSLKAHALSCASTNYLVRFGDHYCREFEKVEPFFTPGGRNVLNCIRPCLIQALNRPDLTCSNLQAVAFASHVKCYSGCGFCDLPVSDKMMIGAVVWREFFNPEFRLVMDKVSEKCMANPQTDEWQPQK